MHPIRVLIVDDHTLFRSGLKSLLQRHEEFEVIGEAGDGLEGVKRAKTLKPEVVLLDLHMPGMSGLEAVRIISEDVPEARVLMLTVSEDEEDLLQTLRAGASGYLLKNVETEFLVDAIRRAAEGESVVAQQMMSKLIHGVRQSIKTREQGSPSEPIGKPDSERLSPREKEILGCLARGESNKEIARLLDVAESTVKIHVQSILRKLNLTSRVQAAVYAVEHGIVPAENN
ncbi:response regulator [Denitratisoma oestradiolicum]|uniref:DNA-binding response regulator in two-component regulatory system with NarX (Or NarQ) n=1 Tax=Denitratisoma oestradiolicum TaxID=311182 RepID=A0A6S6XT75_9PROT|nr:response regulator transcription factor [Denitratisoma oestradiolicum]TWO79347.1 DNA-binding response regulator [Denitratisoma oestradiolicum]CAB1367955.1 DNA-binding response regulator in two-component regulatory system with NarX (or NarQ) [Denitratisoma oestradiolicum]